MSNLGTVLSSKEYERLSDPGAAGKFGQFTGYIDPILTWFDSVTGNDLSQAQKIANTFTAQQSSLAWQREMYADSTKYQREVEDMLAAGINPMMAAKSGAGSVSAFPGQSVSPGSPAMPSLNLGSLLQSVVSVAKMKAEIDNINADTEAKKADTNKKNAETEGVQIDNEFKKKINDSKVEGQKLSNDLSRNQVAETDARIDNLEQDTTLKAKQAATEEERQKYFETASILNRANAYKVTQLLPYQKTLLEAQTEAEKAAAGLAEVQAAYQHGLIDNGYIDNLCKKVAAEAGISEDAKAIADIKAGIRTGDWSGDPVSKFIAKNVLTPLVNIIDNYNPLTDALSGLVTK